MPEHLHEGPGLRVRQWAGPRKTSVRYLGTGLAPEGLGLDGLELPRQMHRCTAGEVRAMRLGPGEWLAIGWEGARPGPFESGLAAIDVTDGLTCFRIEGALARALLAGASSIDFDARAFTPGMAMRTRFARVGAIVECLGADAFVLYVERSVSGYAAAWIAHHAPLVEAAG